ncbi:chaplin [Streptomyces lavendulae]|uniref:chaplin n=1 Tax=Streptomyces lavendulae TaxID=1914 RepID=UPI0033E00510
MRIRTAIAAAALAAVGILGATGTAIADADANGSAVGSSGPLSGNVVQVPIHIPINLCGNSINVIGALNPAAGNNCFNI